MAKIKRQKKKFFRCFIECERASDSVAFVMQYVETHCYGDKGQEYSHYKVADKAERYSYACPKGEEYADFDFARYAFVFLKILYVCSQDFMGKQFLMQAFAAFQKAVRGQQKEWCGG